MELTRLRNQDLMDMIRVTHHVTVHTREANGDHITVLFEHLALEAEGIATVIPDMAEQQISFGAGNHLLLCFCLLHRSPA